MKTDLIERIRKKGRVNRENHLNWEGIAELLAIFDAVGRSGANALLKVDGLRESGSIYTVVISGGELGEDYFRKDGEDLQSLLIEAIDFYDVRVWKS